MRGMEELRILAAALLTLTFSAGVRASGPQAAPPDAKVDARVKALLPSKARIRVAMDLHLTSQGETLIAYEQPDKDSGETVAALVLVREGKRIPFRGQQAEDMILDCRYGSALTFPVETGQQAVALALVCSADGSLMNFMILRWGGNSGYLWDFLEGFHAQLRIASGNPTTMELWAASGGCGDFKRPQVTCRDCPQRYSIRRYEWHGGQLEEKKKGENLTKNCLDPREMGQTPIVFTPAAGH
jgi:hypothetical protein